MTRRLYKTYEEVIDSITEMIEAGVPLHHINIEKSVSVMGGNWNLAIFRMNFSKSI